MERPLPAIPCAFWGEGHGTRGEFAQRLMARRTCSSRASARRAESVNFVVATTASRSPTGALRRQAQRGQRRETNCDGHGHNHSANGVEGPATMPPQRPAVLWPRDTAAFIWPALLGRAHRCCAGGGQQGGNKSPAGVQPDDLDRAWRTPMPTCRLFTAVDRALQPRARPSNHWYTGLPRMRRGLHDGRCGWSRKAPAAGRGLAQSVGGAGSPA